VPPLLIMPMGNVGSAEVDHQAQSVFPARQHLLARAWNLAVHGPSSQWIANSLIL